MNKVLVLDDDPDILEAVQIALSLSGLKVRTIRYWPALDESILQFDPDLILMDISLGTADGRDLCKRLKTGSKALKIPILLFSANLEARASLPDCLAVGFISKPFDLSTLINKVRENLPGQMTASQPPDCSQINLTPC